MQLDKVIDQVAHLDTGARALWFEGRWHTWGEVNALGDGVIALLDQAGVPEDQSIGIALRNDPLCVAVMLAAFRARRPTLTFSPLLPDAALAEDVRNNKPAVLVALATDWERPGLVDAVRDVGAAGIRAGDVSTLVPTTEYRRHAPHYTVASGTAATMLTSGTTGSPKRVSVTLDGLAHAVHSATRHHEGERADAPVRLRDATSIIDLPLFNITSYLDVAMTAAAGRRICLMRRFEPRAWAEAVRDHRVVVSLLVPTAMKMVLDTDIPKEWLQSLRVVRSGSAPLEPQLAEAFEEKYGVPVIVSYGATEFSGALTGLTMADRRAWGTSKRGSVGRPHPGVELRIVDPENGHDVEPGAVGVLLARAPQIAGAQQGEWTRTNDLARIDADGFVFIEGRVDDVIIRGGFKVDPRSVAATLRQHPDVVDAAVIALPDERLGQVPGAAVVLTAGKRDQQEAALQAELQAWVRSHLAPYAVPVVIRPVPALPRTATMKIAQAALAELLRR
ncbi:class I adenylate-forming enzyme family protein [Dactylosporangium sp. AC04546]|uniref:class I adenylate-forming enzyme family protein n=1 Tax=Dactylosporangium sp. AC04546 TaxID=2862460 RepID=UPI001EDCAA92|nr:class I adenylate-forming enzyme family protein [Dactylosporangium sp. AC04546]WVK86978.1 class I adenylate-forming enzyme family protein [Dactylosporangium sp. AC04546]